MKFSPALSLVLSLSVLSSASVAQKPIDGDFRAAAAGTVLNRAGQPWEGAEVTLSSRVHSALTGPEAFDVVRAKTDARGSFRVKLLRNRTYSAWAMARVKDRSFRTTAIADAVTVGIPVVLREAKGRTEETVLQLERLAERRESGPFRALVWIGEDLRCCEPVKIDASDLVTLPPSPTGIRRLQIFDRRGDLFLSAPIGTSKEKVQRLHAGLPIGLAFTYEIRDAETGKGIAGATLYLNDGTGLLPVMRSEKDGVATNRMAHGSVMGFVVSAPGRVMGLPSLPKDFDWAPLRRGANSYGSYYMARATRYSGRLLIGGLPLRDVPVVHRHLASGTPIERVVRTDAEGRFSIHARFKGLLRDNVQAILTEEHMRRLPEPWRRQMHRVVPDFALLPPGGESHDLGSQDLLHFCPVIVEAKDHTGRPSAGLDIVLGGAHDAKTVHDIGRLRTRIRTDSHGIAGFLVRPGTHEIVLQTDGALLARALHVHRDAKDERVAVLRVQLPKPWVVSGVVRATFGIPVHNAQVFTEVDWSQLAPRPEPLAAPRVVTEGNVAQFGPLDAQSFRLHFVSCTPSPTTQTDGKGRFRLLVPPVPCALTVVAHRLVSDFRPSGVRQSVPMKDGSVTNLQLKLR